MLRKEKIFMFVLVSSLVLFLSISLVSASWFDFFKKDKVEITGNVVSGDKIKIMAIGDSITHCGVHNDCWRYWLWKKLNENGYSNRVDFVGNMQGALAQADLNTWSDYEHEGHAGWTADQILYGNPSAGAWSGSGKVGEWAQKYKPDIALIHIGINDYHAGILGDGCSAQNLQKIRISTINEIQAIIVELRKANPNIKIYLAKITGTNAAICNYNDPLEEIRIFNDWLHFYVIGDYYQDNSPIEMVDVYNVFNSWQDFLDNSDGVHFKQQGAKRVGDKWYNSIVKEFEGQAITPKPEPVSPPVSEPVPVVPGVDNSFQKNSFCAKELLKDPLIRQGLVVSTMTFPIESPWYCESKSYAGYDSKWFAFEFGTNTYLCHNWTNPTSINPYILGDLNSGKTFTSYNDRRVRLFFDSSKEEQKGCHITFQDSKTTWPHYGIGQWMGESLDYLFQDYGGFIHLKDYDKIDYAFRIKLNQLSKINGCPGSNDGASFNSVFLLRNEKTGQEFWIVFQPCWTVGSDSCIFRNDLGGLVGDQYSTPAYIIPNSEYFPVIERGKWQTYGYDLKKVASDVINYNSLGNVNDFVIIHHTLHWEISGGYKTDIELKDINLQGFSNKQAVCNFNPGDCYGWLNKWDYRNGKNNSVGISYLNGVYGTPVDNSYLCFETNFYKCNANNNGFEIGSWKCDLGRGWSLKQGGAEEVECVNFNYSNWSNCINNRKTRTLISKQPAGCVGSPLESELGRTCISTLEIPLCGNSDWSSDIVEDNCEEEGYRIREWTKIGNCKNGTNYEQFENISCPVVELECEEFIFSNWSECGLSGTKSRTILRKIPESCDSGVEQSELVNICGYIDLSSRVQNNPLSISYFGGQDNITKKGIATALNSKKGDKKSFFKIVFCRLRFLFSQEKYENCLSEGEGVDTNYDIPINDINRRFAIEGTGINIFGQGVAIGAGLQEAQGVHFTSWGRIEPKAPVNGVPQYETLPPNDWGTAYLKKIKQSNQELSAMLEFEHSEWGIERDPNIMVTSPRNGGKIPGLVRVKKEYEEDYKNFIKHYISIMPNLRYLQVDNEPENVWVNGEGYARIVELTKEAITEYKQEHPETNIQVMAAGFNLGLTIVRLPEDVKQHMLEKYPNVDQEFIKRRVNEEQKKQGQDPVPEELLTSQRIQYISQKVHVALSVLRQKNPSFDILTIHLYGPSPYDDIEEVLSWYKEQMNAYGYSRPIWIDDMYNGYYFGGEIEYDKNIRQGLVDNNPETISLMTEMQSTHLVRNVAGYFAAGTERVKIAYLFDYPAYFMPEWRYAGLFEKDDSRTAKPSYYTTKIMVNKLDHFVTATKLENYIYKFTFENKGNVYVAWSEEGAKTIDLSKEFNSGEVRITHIVTELKSNKEPVYLPDEIVSSSEIPLTETPIFIEEK